MMSIPFDPSVSADQSFQILIPENILLTLQITWNVRGSSWYLQATSPDGVSLGRVKLTPDFPLFYGLTTGRPMTGDLIVLPLDRTVSGPIEYSALGSSWGLFYMDAEEVSQWEKYNGVG